MAFLKVNRPVEFPLDLKGIVSPPTRTLELMNEAEAHLAIAKEQIKYAQFWFLQKMSPLDDIAFNHLLAGNMEGAIEIWSKQDTLSSLQNKLVCFLIENKPELAIKAAEKLYEKFGNDYVSKVDVNCTLQMTGTELLHQFIDSLGEEIGMQELLGYVLGADTKAYVSSQTIGPLINMISTEVDKTKKVDHKDPKARIEAGEKLMWVTKEPLQQLKNILTAKDPQYVMTADKLGQEILQCGIDYFNNTNDNEAARKAITLQKYALTIVEGQLARQRCEENVKILEKIIDNLPPTEVMAEDMAIKAALSKYVKLPDKITHAVTLLTETKQHLQDIKSKLGSTHTYYLRMTTLVVNNALHNVIAEVNAAQNDPQLQLHMKLRMVNESDLWKLSSVLRSAWEATQMMDQYELEPEAKEHYDRNRNQLKSLCSQVGVSTSTSFSSSSSGSGCMVLLLSIIGIAAMSVFGVILMI